MALIGSRSLLFRNATNDPPLALMINALATFRPAEPPPVSLCVLAVRPPWRETVAPAVFRMPMRSLLIVHRADKSPALEPTTLGTAAAILALLTPISAEMIGIVSLRAARAD